MKLLLILVFSISASAQITGQYVQVIPSPDASITGTLGFLEKSNAATAHYVGFAAPDVVPADVRWILPAADGAAGTVLTTNGSKVLSWTAGGGGGSSPPFADSAALVKNSTDSTKLILFGANLISPATTRILTAQNANYIIAGTNVDNLFSIVETFKAQINVGVPSTNIGILNIYSNVDAVNREIGATQTGAGGPALSVWASILPAGPNPADLGDLTSTAVWTNSYITTAHSQALRLYDNVWDVPLWWKFVNTGTSTAYNLTLSGPSGSSFMFWNENASEIGMAATIWPLGASTADIGKTGASGWRHLYMRGTLDMSTGVTPIAATAGLGLMYFNGVKFQCSENGAAYSACFGGGIPPFADSVALVKDSADNTKLLLFDATLIATGTTKVLTAQNANYTMAGTNIDNKFTTVETFNAQANFGTANTNIGILNIYAATDAFNREIGASQTAAGGQALSVYASILPAGPNPANLGDFPSNPWTNSYITTENSQALRLYDNVWGFFWKFVNTGTSTQYNLTLSGPSNSTMMFFDDTADQIGMPATLWPLGSTTSDIGKSTGRFRKLWVQDIDLSGTCTGCPGGAGGTAPFSDAGPLVKNATDATKTITLNAASITTANNRILTAQDKNYIIAGTDVANQFTQSQAPATSNSYDLGSVALQWRNAFLATSLNVGNGKLLVQTAQPQISAAGLGNPLVIQGSNTGNSDIYLMPGNLVGGGGRVILQNQRNDNTILLINQAGGGDIVSGYSMLITNAAGGAVFGVVGSANPTLPNAVQITSTLYPLTNNAADLGGSANQFHTLWAGTSVNLGVGKLVTQIAQPQINAGGLNAALVLQGSSTGDGSIYLIPGNVTATVNTRSVFVMPTSSSNIVFRVYDSVVGDRFAINGTAATPANAVSVWGPIIYGPSSAAPQLDASGLGSVLTIKGSNTVNGNVLITPGNVAANSRLEVQSVRTDNTPLFILYQAGGNLAGDVFEVQNSAGATVFAIQGAATANPNTVAVAGNIVPFPTLTYSLGLNTSNRFAKLWVQDIDLSGTCTGCPGGGGGGTVLSAVMTVGAQALAATYVDVTGASVTLTNGTWLVTGSFTFSTQGGNGGNNGRLMVNGVAQAGTAQLTVVGVTSSAMIVTASQQWVITNLSGSVIAKLQANNAGPTITNATVNQTTTITAVLIHP